MVFSVCVDRRQKKGDMISINRSDNERGIMVAKQKSASAFRTIGEVANELKISPHVLRFWEGKFRQIKPHKRRGGHRYYRPMDVEVIKEIKSLLYERGFTIKGAQNYLKEQQKTVATNQSSLFDEGSEGASEKVVTIGKMNDTLKQHVLDELKALHRLLG